MLAQGDPLLAAGHAGLVARLRRLLAGQPVNERGLAHVRDAHDHQAQVSLPFPAFVLLVADLLQQAQQRRGACARVAVHGQHVGCALLQFLCPFHRLRFVRQIALVQHDDAGLALRQFRQDGIAARYGNAGVEHFDAHVHELQVFLDQLAGLFHVTRIPVDMFHFDLL